MKTYEQYELLQLEAILACQFAKRNWVQEFLPAGKKLQDATFSDVFAVGVDDVLAFAARFGWDPRVVELVNRCPVSEESGASWYLQLIEGNCKIYLPRDRGEWVTVNFLEPRLAKEYLAKAMLHAQWSFWNHDWLRRHQPRNTEALRYTFPPPKGMRQDEI